MVSPCTKQLSYSRLGMMVVNVLLDFMVFEGLAKVPWGVFLGVLFSVELRIAIKHFKLSLNTYSPKLTAYTLTTLQVQNAALPGAMSWRRQFRSFVGNPYLRKRFKDQKVFR
ncbi:uncharacterized protein LY89DRAFT_478468 [Mollisia scopiformis]|uniref:Uncharacterized protein n=1 Tax=Mollisia scopiformis TaxID=149040 RepID=A0A194XG06_MOLSC|nr:uncharacterized protein LY89DRAFT_478468 [Mollisia scopiformis]KUJ19130.1 hypothetical protein LY89DRAFT_478468 [Mollisia scopiformis]